MPCMIPYNFIFATTLLLVSTLHSVCAQRILINAGGEEYRDGSTLWIADRYYNNGETFETSTEIANTANSALYQTERSSGSEQNFLSYNIPVPQNRRYKVRLHFSENSEGAQGKGLRVFHVVINGVMVTPNLDIFDEAGGGFHAMSKEFRTMAVGAGFIKIELIGVKQKPKVNAIGIRQAFFVDNNDAPIHPDIQSVLNVKGGVTPGGKFWADSYSVGDRCYCVSTFDHNIGTVMVHTQVGWMTVKEACDLLGAGPGYEGNPLYNDVQCGNGPPNDASDEHVCPGRVDIGVEGCGHIGPTWKFVS